MRGSFTSLSKAGSLLSIGGRERRKGSKVSDMAKRVSGRVGGRKEGRMDRLEQNFGRLGTNNNNNNRDPGVNSEEEDEDMMMVGGRDDMFQFDRLSHCSSSLRSELSLNRLGTVSPAASTPDLEAMRRSSNNHFEGTKTEVNNFDQEVKKKLSSLSDFESTMKPSKSVGVESARRSINDTELLDMNINDGWKKVDNDRRISNEDGGKKAKEDGREIAVKSPTLAERPPSAETVAEDYSLPSYHQVVAIHV